MAVSKISDKFTLQIPKRFRSKISPGQEVVITLDEKGRILITPVEQIRSALVETFGMWEKHADLPQDSIRYVDEIRRGNRLSHFLAENNEAD
jgi:bifunctional DNA-binding transcriptional regulator/antitoxin component of YhaV-PrlF toxin-antitoxin module